MSGPARSAGDESGPATVRTLPTLAEGTELVGEFKNSGYKEPPQLVRLANRQLVRLPPVLFMVARALEEHRSLSGTRDVREALDTVADSVSQQAGARLSTEQLIFLVDGKLAPLGVTNYSDGTPPPVVKANPFFALKFRVALVPEKVTWALAGMFTWLFRPLIVVLTVATVIVAEVWVLATQSVASALQQTIAVPVSILLILGLGIASAAFHEFGHAAACRYAGVRPGVMGCGIYIVWPVFYTDITESYRLGRAGRLRADLAGVYFNGVFLIGLTLLYLATGFAPLLVAILYVNLEMLQQLLPTLRFDGYYIMSDLIGIPDLFKYIGPILRRKLLRRPADARLNDLKRWPQILVTVWVLTVIPVLLFQLAFIAYQIPALFAQGWWMVRQLVAEAMNGAETLAVIAAGLQITILILPVLGVSLILFSFARALVRWAIRYVNAPAPQPVEASQKAAG